MPSRRAGADSALPWKSSNACQVCSLRRVRRIFGAFNRMTEFINYIVCFVFGVMTGAIAVTATVVMFIKEKAPNRGP